MPISNVYNSDCLLAMKEFPDKFFELAIVDPPYGIGVNHSMGRRKGDRPSGHKPAVWDNQSPDLDYFGELFRVSKEQIIWGANHFISKMPLDSPCWIMWDKGFSEELSFAQFELAWTSFETTSKKYDAPTNNGQAKIHPTQKPIALYKWLLKNYAKDGDKILDTHLGSGSSRIAADQMGFDFWGYELDKDYFDASVKRFNDYKSQLNLFPKLPLV